MYTKKTARNHELKHATNSKKTILYSFGDILGLYHGQIEVIMADGANQATEVIRFTQKLEFNNLIARILLLLGSSDKYWSYKCFNPYFLDQPVRIFVNGWKFSNQYTHSLPIRNGDKS